MGTQWWDREFYHRRSQENPVTVTRILMGSTALIIARGADKKMEMGARSIPPEFWVMDARGK